MAGVQESRSKECEEVRLRCYSIKRQIRRETNDRERIADEGDQDRMADDRAGDHNFQQSCTLEPRMGALT